MEIYDASHATSETITSSSVQDRFLLWLGKFGIVCIVDGVLALTGSSTISFNGQYLQGISGLIGGVVFAFLLSVLSGLFAFLGMMVVRFIARWKDFGEIHFTVANENTVEEH